MLSNREGAGVRSARKYALHTSSPLAKDSTNLVTPVRPSTRGGGGMGGKRDSFSSSNHVGSEAKEAMLRGGLKVKRTHSLRMVATKGNATLTAMFHNFPTPDLDLFRKLYQRLEPEFAEQIPSAVCPFQFVTNESSDIVPRWQRSKSVDSIFNLEEDEQEQEDDKMSDWLKDMRLKVHSRLAQKHQIANTANPIEPPQESSKRPLSPKTSPESKKKEKEKDKLKLELNLDTIEPPSSSPRSHSARTFAKPRLSPKSSSRVAPLSSSSSSSSSASPPSSPSKKSKQEKRLPPIQPRSPLPTSASASPLTPLSPSASSGGKPRLPKIASQDTVDAAGPLFYPRNDPIYARRTYSELDVRRVRAKARNSVGLEPSS